MIPAAFEYHRPDALARAVDLLERLGDEAKLLAGGHSLIPTMKVRMNQPQHIIDLGGVPELKGISVEHGFLRVGAMTTHWEVESSAVVKSAIPVLSEVASVIADPQVRNRGTIGGSISNADPAADYPASIVAFDADLICIGPDGERTMKGTDWFQGLFTTGLEENEILREIRFPLPRPNTAAAYLKLPHPASRFAVVGVAVMLTTDEANRCSDASIGITGIGTHAVRARAVEDGLRGRLLTDELIAVLSEHAVEGLEISDDLHFSVEDKQQLCRVYVKRAVIEAAARAAAGQFQR
jgi:aerobic carbon-monoxide dehydrogenase medium subunit